MLDANVILQDVEELLDGHYKELQIQTQMQLQNRVRVYDAPPQPPTVQRPPASQKAAHPLNELVANVFVLLMLSVLNNGLAKQPSR